MKGWGLAVRVNRTRIFVYAWPFRWGWETSLMSPAEYGFGVWILKDHFA